MSPFVPPNLPPGGSEPDGRKKEQHRFNGFSLLFFTICPFRLIWMDLKYSRRIEDLVAAYFDDKFFMSGNIKSREVASLSFVLWDHGNDRSFKF